MKKIFLLKIVAFLGIALMLVSVLVLLAFNVDPVYQKEKFIINQLISKSDSITALAVGNSHNRGLDFSILGIKGYHLWQGGNDVFEVNYQLKALMPKLPVVNTVFYCAPYYLLSWDNASSKVQDRSELRRKYYNAIPSFTWIKGDFNNFMLAKLAFVIRADHWSSVAKKIISRLLGRKGKPAEFFIRADGSRHQPVNYTSMELEELNPHVSDYIVPRFTKIMNDMKKNNKNLARQSRDVLEETILLLKEQNVRVVFYTPPYYRLYSELFDESTKNEMNTAMKDLQHKFDIEYYDFSNDSELINEHSFYRDGHHLNFIGGAEAFSKKFKKALDNNLSVSN